MNPRQLLYANALEIPLWREREEHFSFFGGLFKIGVQCCILLSSEIQSKEEGFSVLAGMVKVLGIPADNYSVGWPTKKKEPIIEDFCRILAEINPGSILFMGRDAGSLLEQHLSQALRSRLHVTSHPDALVTNPREKRQAFNELLGLKAALVKQKV